MVFSKILVFLLFLVPSSEGCLKIGKSCNSCNMESILIGPTNPNFTYHHDENEPVDGCLSNHIYCFPDGMERCDISMIYAKNADGSYSVPDDHGNGWSIGADFVCGQDGTYSFGDITGITEIKCVLEDCTPSVCQSCDINQVLDEITDPHVTAYIDEFYSDANSGARCRISVVECRLRDDSVACNDTQIFAYNSDGRHSVAEVVNPSDISALFECDGTGFYYIGNITGITRIECSFKGCPWSEPEPENLCNTCDMDAIFTGHIDTHPNFIHAHEENDPVNGCKNTHAWCTADGMDHCSTKYLYADNENGSYSIPSKPNTADWSIGNDFSCNRDGTYSFGDITGITQIKCYVDDCIPKICTTCDIHQVFDEVNHSRVDFYTEEEPLVEGCKSTYTTCSRRDIEDWCYDNHMFAYNADGQHSVAEFVSILDIDATFRCDGDGTYSIGNVTGITRIECSFANCTWESEPEPENLCNSCDMDAIFTGHIDTHPNFIHNHEENDPVNGCKNTHAWCSADGMDHCSTKYLYADNENGSYSIPSKPNTADWSIGNDFSCDRDGTYSFGDITGITQIRCYVDDCVPKICTTCDIHQVFDEVTDPYVEFYTEDLPLNGTCKNTWTLCRLRDPTEICYNNQMFAYNSDGKHSVAEHVGAESVGAYFRCDEDGTYSSGNVTGITRIECSLDGCPWSQPEPGNLCNSCDMDAIFTGHIDTHPNFVHNHEDNDPVNGCKNTHAWCTADGMDHCSTKYLYADNENGSYSIPSKPNTADWSVGNDFSCDRDGTYSFGDITGITQIKCYVDDCIPKICTTCDIHQVFDEVTNPRVEFYTEEDPLVEGCKSTYTNCMLREVADLCYDNHMFAYNSDGQHSVATFSSPIEVEATFRCDGDGTYSIGNVTGITRIECSFADCHWNLPDPLCTTCDIHQVFDEVTNPRVAFYTEEKPPVEGCKSTYTVCQLRDVMDMCDDNHMFAYNADGRHSVADDITIADIAATFRCAGDGTYSIGNVTGITRIECSFGDCNWSEPEPEPETTPEPVETCSSCDLFSNFHLPADANFIANFQDAWHPSACMTTLLTCTLKPGVTCTDNSIFFYDVDSNRHNVAQDVSETHVSATFTCSKDGYWIGNWRGITSVECSFQNCTTS